MRLSVFVLTGAILLAAPSVIRAEEPTTNAAIVGQAFNGSTVFVQGRSNDGAWYLITLPEDGSQAWLFSNLTAVVTGDPATTPAVE